MNGALWRQIYYTYSFKVIQGQIVVSCACQDQAYLAKLLYCHVSSWFKIITKDKHSGYCNIEERTNCEVLPLGAPQTLVVLLLLQRGTV